MINKPDIDASYLSRPFDAIYFVCVPAEPCRPEEPFVLHLYAEEVGSLGFRCPYCGREWLR